VTVLTARRRWQALTAVAALAIAVITLVVFALPKRSPGGPFLPLHAAAPTGGRTGCCPTALRCNVSGSRSAARPMSPRFVLLLVVGGIVLQRAACARRLQLTITDERYPAQIRQAAALAANSPKMWSSMSGGRLIGLLDLQAWRFEHGSLLGHPPQLLPDGAVVTGRAAGTWTRRPAQRGDRAAGIRQPPARGREQAERCLVQAG
jgi:hypothetical protein